MSYNTLHYIILHYITLHYITLHYITLHYITLHYITLHYITLHYITLHYITLYYITLHYITLHYITLHYITLHYIILHYITLYILEVLELYFLKPMLEECCCMAVVFGGWPNWTGKAGLVWTVQGNLEPSTDHALDLFWMSHHPEFNTICTCWEAPPVGLYN